MPKPVRVALLGASGNIGRSVARSLLSYSEDVVGQVLTINRRPLDIDSFPHDDRRLEHHIVNMNSGATLEEGCAPLLEHLDAVIATMGIGSGKGSFELFQKVDVELPSAFARAAVNAGVRRATLVSAVGADIENRSSWLLRGVAGGKYFHLKGLVEKNYVEAGFVDGLVIFRPAGLLGTEHIPGWLDYLLPKLDWMAPARFRSVHVEQVGAAMAHVVVDANSPNKVSILQGHNLFSVLPGRRSRPVA